jgi:hypothetical protein
VRPIQPDPEEGTARGRDRREALTSSRRQATVRRVAVQHLAMRVGDLPFSRPVGIDREQSLPSLAGREEAAEGDTSVLPSSRTLSLERASQLEARFDATVSPTRVARSFIVPTSDGRQVRRGVPKRSIPRTYRCQ